MNIIVTGASRGIGNALVKELSKEPENCIFAVARNRTALRELSDECIVANPTARVHPVAFDLTTPELSRRLIPRFGKRTDRIDILINNAGLLIHKPFPDFTPEDIDHLMQVNFKAAFLLIQALQPKMNAGSHILNIGSMGGVQGSAKFQGMSVYSASKGALAILTECLAEELRPSGISVNMVALGAVDTAMLQMAFPGYKAPMSAEEIAPFIAYFSKNGHHFMNGKIIPLSVSTP